MDRAILAVCPTWGPPEDVPSEAARRHDAVVASLSDLTDPGAITFAASDGELVFAWIEGIVDALTAALDLRERHPEAIVGLGWGPGPVASSEPSRVRRLAWRAPAGVRCTAAFRASLGSPPAGVGLYRTPHDLEHRFGFEAYDLADYRR